MLNCSSQAQSHLDTRKPAQNHAKYLICPKRTGRTETTAAKKLWRWLTAQYCSNFMSYPPRIRRGHGFGAAEPILWMSQLQQNQISHITMYKRRNPSCNTDYGPIEVTRTLCSVRRLWKCANRACKFTIPAAFCERIVFNLDI